MTEKMRNAALILAAHGSHRHPAASKLIHGHAAAIRSKNMFADVRVGFWHGTPKLSDVLSGVRQETAYVVPVFKSDGHFTRVIIPREMDLTGRTTRRSGASGARIVHLCKPVGNHPSIPKLVKGLAIDACLKQGVSARDTHVLIIGHGGRASSGSEISTERVVKALADSGTFRSITALYLEQEPIIDHWRQIGLGENIVAVPFLIGGGGHDVEISARLGAIGEDKLAITRAVGELSNISQIIADQALQHHISKPTGNDDTN